MADVEDPKPGAGEVLVAVRVAGVNFSDLRRRQGPPGGAPLPEPYIPGLEAAGTVVAVGPGASRFKPGDRVIAFPRTGAYAELAVAAEALVGPVPETLDFTQAAAFPLVAGAAYALLKDAGRVRSGEAVVVHAAAGAVGTAALQIARILGAGTVVGLVGAEWKAREARRLGADPVIAREEEGYAQAVLDATGGRGADVILNSVGGASLLEDLDCLAPFGRLVAFGESGGGGGEVPSEPLHRKSQSVVGYSFNRLRTTRPEEARNIIHEAAVLVSSGQVEIPVSRRFPLAEAAAAHAHIESRQSIGKVLLDVG